MGAYIINVPSTVDRIIYVNVHPMDGKTYLASYSVDELTPYTEPDLEQVRKEAYQKGYETGYEDGYNEPGKNQQETYQRGLSDAWEACRKIVCYEIDGGHPVGHMLNLFERDDIPKILSDYTAAEAIEKLKAYEQKQDAEIKVGDEVVFGNDEEIKAVVIDEADEAGVWFLLSENGCVERMDSNLFHRTGRHFPEIATVLKKMRGEQDG